MKELDADANIRRKRMTRKATIIFLSVMLILTFFSKTINNFTLPKVTYENPSRGALIKEITGTGIVQAKTIHDQYISSNMKVTGVMVEVGDTVRQGQTILTLDTTSLKNQLKDEEDRLTQKKLYLEKLMEAGERLQEANLPENLLNLDKAVQTAQQNLEAAQRQYESSKALYEIGGVSAKVLADAEVSLMNAKMDYEIAKNNRDRTIRENSRDLENNKRDIESTKLDIDMMERKIDELRKEIDLGSVSAPCDGIVIELHFTEGMTANTLQPLYRIADINGGFQFVTTVNANAAEYLEPGDAAEIFINSINNTRIEGRISQIKDNQQQMGVKKDVIIDMISDQLNGGEIGTACIKKNMGSYSILVPNSAVGTDSNGYFVYVLKEREGPLGNEFFVEKVSVSIGDSDNIRTAILSGINARDHVISYSDKPLSDGSRVMLAN